MVSKKETIPARRISDLQFHWKPKKEIIANWDTRYDGDGQRPLSRKADLELVNRSCTLVPIGGF